MLPYGLGNFFGERSKTLKQVRNIEYAGVWRLNKDGLSREANTKLPTF